MSKVGFHSCPDARVQRTSNAIEHMAHNGRYIALQCLTDRTVARSILQVPKSLIGMKGRAMCIALLGRVLTLTALFVFG